MKIVLLVVLCHISTFGADLELAVAYLPCNNNNAEAIESDIRRLDLEKIHPMRKGQINLKNAKLDTIYGPGPRASREPNSGHFFVRVGNIDVPDEPSIRRSILKFTQMRFSGFTPEFANYLLLNGKGINWGEFKIGDEVLSQNAKMPGWLMDCMNIPDNARVCSIDDGYVRRFLVVISNIVEGEVAIDIRDAGNDYFRNALIKEAIAAIGPHKGSEGSKLYFARLSQWLFKEKGVSWTSPYEIPDLPE